MPSHEQLYDRLLRNAKAIAAMPQPYTYSQPPRKDTMKVSLKMNLGRQFGGMVAPTSKSPGRAEVELDVDGVSAEQLEHVAEIAGECAERIAGAIGIEAVTVVKQDGVE